MNDEHVLARDVCYARKINRLVLLTKRIMRFYFHAFLFYKKYILYFKDAIFTLHKQVEYHDRSFVIIVIPSVS